jgi:hypothetical protein
MTSLLRNDVHTISRANDRGLVTGYTTTALRKSFASSASVLIVSVVVVIVEEAFLWLTRDLRH